MPRFDGVASTLIRRATREDAPFLAWAILAATRSHLPRGWFDIALNKPESACLGFLRYLTTTKTISNWHYSKFLIVECQNEPASALSAFRAKDAYPLSTIAIWETMHAWGMSATDATEMWERSAYMFRCTIRPHDEYLLVDTVATHPSFRGQGHTTKLLSRAIEIAKEQGISHAQVTLFIGNDAAERIYVSAGFHLAKERRDAQFEARSGAPGIRQYLKEL